MDEARNQAQNAGKSKGAEVSALLTKFNREKAELEASLTEKQAIIDEFLRQMEDQQGDADRIRQVLKINKYTRRKNENKGAC